VTAADNKIAQDLLQKAVTVDPNYGQALGLLATSHLFGGHAGWEDMASAAEIAERSAHAAIRSDTEDPWAHVALGYVHLIARRFDASLAEFEWALRLNPNFALAQGYYSLALSYNARWQEADEAPPDIQRIDEAEVVAQRDRIRTVRATRDQALVERLLDEVGETARGTANLLPPMKEALRAGATLGEVSDALRAVFGVYTPSR